MNQTSSYELQKNHFTDLVNRNPNWKLVDIYADEGISGISLKHRDSFLRMIKDCEDGKIDLIVTKSVSRFARNLLDCVGQIRKLSAMTPPVGVFFETENINTLNSQSELSIALISTMAQEESHTKSEIMNASIEMRFRKGIFLTPVPLGYDHDEDGNLVINEEEAKTVRLIFFMYLYGYSCQLGKLIRVKEDVIILFDLSSPEVYKRNKDKDGKTRTSRIPNYPSDWQNQFGVSVAEHQCSLVVNFFENTAIFGMEKDPGKAETKEAVETIQSENENEVKENFEELLPV